MARNEYFSGVTPEFKQQRLREITSAKVNDLHSYTEAFAEMTARSYRSIIGNRPQIEWDKDLFDGLTEL